MTPDNQFNPDLAVRSREDVRLIAEALSVLAPLESAVVGEPALRAIAANAAISQVEGGRHLDWSPSLSDLSNLATVLQCVVAALIWITARATVRRSNSDKVVEETHRLVGEALAKNPELHETFLRHPDSVLVVMRLRDHPSPDSVSGE